MAKVVFHMGTHKTATTTVQDSFHANAGVLAEHGVIYPVLGRHSGHHGLLMDWIALPGAYQLPRGGIGTLKALADRYEGTDKTLFLSSEEFSRAGGPGGQVDMSVLRAIFAEYEEVRVILCLRTQWQFLQSTYLEITRSRCPPSPPELVADALATGQVDGLWCDYGALYDHLCSVFEPEQIHLMDFKAACDHPGGIVGAMLGAVNSTATAEHLAPVTGHSNVSPRALPVWAAHAMLPQSVATSGPDGAQLLQVLDRTFDLEYGAARPCCIFTRAEMARLNACFTPRNTALAARVFGMQPGFSLPWVTPPPSVLYREDVGTALWVRAARRIFSDMVGPVAVELTQDAQ